MGKYIAVRGVFKAIYSTGFMVMGLYSMHFNSLYTMKWTTLWSLT